MHVLEEEVNVLNDFLMIGREKWSPITYTELDYIPCSDRISESCLTFLMCVASRISSD